MIVIGLAILFLIVVTLLMVTYTSVFLIVTLRASTEVQIESLAYGPVGKGVLDTEYHRHVFDVRYRFIGNEYGPAGGKIKNGRC